MLWLAVPASPQPAPLCPWGALACFLLAGRWRYNGCESAQGREGGGAYLLLIAPPLYLVDLFQQ